MKGGVLFCVLFAIVLRSIHNSQIGVRSSSRSVEECGAKAIETIFGKEQVYFVYYDNLNDLLPFHVSNPKILVSNESMRLTKRSFYNYVIQATNISTFMKSMTSLSEIGRHIRNGRFLVITDQHNLTNAVFRWYWEYNVTYVAMLAIDHESRTKSLLLTGDPNDALNYCGNELNVFHNQSCIGSITDTIPKASRNYNGCPVTVGILIKWRYDYDPRSYTMHVMQEVFNVSFVFIDLNEHPHPSPDVYGDLSLTKEIFTDYGSSHVFARDNVVFVVPPADKISYMEVLIIAFRKEVWISIFLAFVLFVPTWYVICRFKVNLGTIILNTVSMTFCGSSNCIPNCSTARFLIMCYIIYSIHIQTAYIAELMRLLMWLPSGKHIESVEELFGTNLSIWLDLESTHMIEMSSSPLTKTLQISKRCHLDGDSYNLTKSWYAGKSFSFSILLKTLQSIELSLQVSSPPYFLMEKEILSTIMNVFGSLDCGYCIDSIDVIIDRLTENGLYDKLDQDRKFYAEAEKTKFISAEEVVAFSFEHLSGVFVVFGCGLLLSSMAFLGELIVHRLTN